MAVYKGNKAKQKDFKWTDDKAELLLSVTLDYKAKKAAENVDWESVKSKYDDMQAEMPAEKTERPIKDYPHLKSEMTRAVLSTKLKNVRQRYRHRYRYVVMMSSAVSAE